MIQVDGANGSSSEDELDDDEDYDNYPVARAVRDDADDPAEVGMIKKYFETYFN